MYKNKSLIENNKSIFIKVIIFFKKMFWRKETQNCIEKIDDLKIENKSEVKHVIKPITSILKEDEISEDIELYEYEEEIDPEEVNFEKYNENREYNSQDEKNNFFDLYNNIKEEKVDINNVDIIDLFQVNLLLKEEQKLKKAKINEKEKLLLNVKK